MFVRIDKFYFAEKGRRDERSSLISNFFLGGGFANLDTFKAQVTHFTPTSQTPPSFLLPHSFSRLLPESTNDAHPITLRPSPDLNSVSQPTSSNNERRRTPGVHSICQVRCKASFPRADHVLIVTDRINK